MTAKTPNPAPDEREENEVSAIIERLVKGNVGEDGFVIVDYAELRDTFVYWHLTEKAKAIEAAEWSRTEGRIKAVLSLEQELRVQFDANRHDFSTFEFMIAQINDYVAELHRQNGKGATEK